MSETKLPEELLREVLSYCFTIPHESFCGFPTRVHAPLADARRVSGPESSHNLLLVCKRWLRVGFPLLYESISLRTSTHAQTVAILIKQNPMLGRAVRQLKLFGGYGKDLYAIVKAAPNLQTVYLNMSMRSSDSITGIRRALSIMNPTRLYIEERPRKRNKKTSELRELLNANIGKWSSLKYIHYNPHYHFTTRMISALKEALTLEEVWVDALSVLSIMDDDDRELHEFLVSTSMSKLHCLGTRFQDDVIHTMEDLQYPDKAQKMMVYEDYASDGADDVPPYDPLLWDDSDDEFETWISLLPLHIFCLSPLFLRNCSTIECQYIERSS